MQPDWKYPETWQVGDTLDAATLNSRIRDQNSILLRKPLTVARRTTNHTLTSGGVWAVQWDTLDIDDDGMDVQGAVAGGTLDTFYIQRDGTYQVWYTACFAGNTFSGDIDINCYIDSSVTYRRWDSQARMCTNNAQWYFRSVCGTMFLKVGENLQFTAWQDTGHDMTFRCPAFGCPRVAILWLGIT